MSMSRSVAPGPSTSIIDILDRVLDKGIVIDAWIRVSLVGIDLITVEARVVVASIDTYLRYAEALGITGTVARPAAGPGSTGGSIGSGGTSGTPSSAPAGAAERR